MPLRFRPEVLVRVRLEQGLSRDKLAAAAKVSRVSIFMVETGRTAPRPETVKAIADALGIPVGDLYEDVADEDVAS